MTPLFRLTGSAFWSVKSEGSAQIILERLFGDDQYTYITFLSNTSFSRVWCVWRY